MSEKMYPIPFASLMNWIVTEYAQSGDIFGVHKKYEATGKSLPIFGERIETPFGPAAGPNSQLAQNIIAAYFAGARFFEVKTVQKMDGADLAACVPRPCILAADEGYNQEWSTELTVPQAQDEYIKAWCALKVISKVYGLGDPDGFVFNMSVGYDLEGIKGRKVNSYIDNMMDASRTAQFKECKKVLTELFPAERDFIAHISPRVSRSVTVSTLHGCPPQEIERIASYLLKEKHLHTFVKCNPTILGYKTARSILDSMGYDYVVFDEHHFNEDLQWEDAVPMFERLQKLADKQGLEFGLKLSNTFPVDTTRGELPNEEMYMSGRSLFPLTIEMCNRISRQFGGKMRISFAGGADYFNCDKLFAAGIWPITVATTILKPGGYNRLHQMVEKVQEYRTARLTAMIPLQSPTLPPPRCTTSTTSSPSSRCPPARAKIKFLFLTALPLPARAAAPSSRTFPNTLSSAARGSTAQRSASSLRRTPCRLSPAPSARTAARASARATSMRNLSTFARRSFSPRKRATARSWRRSVCPSRLTTRRSPSSAAARPVSPRRTSLAARVFLPRSLSASASSAACRAMSSPPSASATRPSTRTSRSWSATVSRSNSASLLRPSNSSRRWATPTS